MTKNDIIEHLVLNEGISRSTAMKAVNGTFQIIGHALAKGDDVTLRGFGTFKVAQVAQKKARNISTGEPITVPAHKAVKLVVCKELKDAIR